MRAAGLVAAGALALIGVIALAIFTLPQKPQRLALAVSGYDALDGWSHAALKATAQAYARSCARLSGRAAEAPMGRDARFGTVGDWQAPCGDFLSLDLSTIDDTTLRTFFETRFVPVRVSAGSKPQGLFTGYFEPEYDGSLMPGGGFDVPLYGRPMDLVTVDLGRFNDAWKGQRISGRISGSQLVPFPTRGEIEDGALGGSASPIVWLKDRVDAFFLQIQGSGVVLLPDGEKYRIGYAAQNGRDYTPIGRVLRQRAALSPDNISMQSIRDWLEHHPGQADEVMRQNQSYVFFRPVAGEGPVGSEGVPLTAGYSLAVDRSFLPLGVPVWLQTQAPTDGKDLKPIDRLMVTQDTGGAIKGPVRGDIFWGTGDAAGEVAGHMASQGRYFILMPKALAAALGEG